MREHVGVAALGGAGRDSFEFKYRLKTPPPHPFPGLQTHPLSIKHSRKLKTLGIKSHYGRDRDNEWKRTVSAKINLMYGTGFPF